MRDRIIARLLWIRLRGLVASVSQPGSARRSPGLYRELLRLLARGEPVTIRQLSAAAGQAAKDVQRIVTGWRDTEYDLQGRIVGYGLTLRPTSHRFGIEGKQLYTWCALDTLFIPAVIDREARIDSACASTGVPIHLTVDPASGIGDLDPATAVVSIVTPENLSSIRASFCNRSRFFVSGDAACQWQAETLGLKVLSVADAYSVGHSLSDMLLDKRERPLGRVY